MISTGFGGVDVTDMDTGRRLWGDGGARSHGQLEYDMETGTAAWDTFEDIVEVWRVDDEVEGKRGVFKRIGRLSHDFRARGF